MEQTVWAASWFLPFAVPICLYIAFTDVKAMRIPNHAVIALTAVFATVGLIAYPLETYAWQYLNLIIVLLAGIALNAAGLVGAGDAKFCAAAAPMVIVGDWNRLIIIFAVMLLAAWIAHRVAKHSPIRNLAPEWESWTKKKDFPMGLALGPTLIAYLSLSILYGAS